MRNVFDSFVLLATSFVASTDGSEGEELEIGNRERGSGARYNFNLTTTRIYYGVVNDIVSGIKYIAIIVGNSIIGISQLYNTRSERRGELF